jgi:hypothetical protein
MRRPGAAVRRQCGRHLGQSLLGNRRLNDHLTCELHPGRLEIEREYGLPIKAAQTAMRPRSRRSLQGHVADRNIAICSPAAEVRHAGAAAVAARASMRGTWGQTRHEPQERCALMQAEQRASAPQRSNCRLRPPHALHGERLPLPKILKKTILASRPPGIWGMSEKRPWEGR